LKGVAAYLVWSDTPYEKLDELMADPNIWGRDLTTIPGLINQLKIIVKNISNGRLL
jgi:hypothetical protein